jgi:hypothetical protein
MLDETRDISIAKLEAQPIRLGDHIAISLNGVLINGVFDVWPTNGPILLQCEGSEIFIRKFELQPLR